MNLNSDTLFSAVKRRDILGILKYLFEENGNEAALEVANNTTRMTALAIDKMRKALNEVSETVEIIADDETELDYQDAINEESEKNDELILLERKVTKAIGKGDHKKAKNALKKLIEAGVKGTEIDSLKKQVKALKKG